MHIHFDQFAKNLLREALGRAAREVPETEVEVQPGAQTIDVYSVADPAREAERRELGLLGELAGGRTLFEPFRNTPSLREVRSCLRKQLNWHHELERREKREVEFPTLVIIGPGLPRTALRAFGCSASRAGVYDAVDGLGLRIVILAELPRARETLLLRLLGSGKTMREALDDLAELPTFAWEQSLVPLLLHLRLIEDEDEDDVTNTEIRAWYDEYQRKQREQSLAEQEKAREEGVLIGQRRLILRLLEDRFGEVPPAFRSRVESADLTELETWGKRVIAAETIAGVFADLE